MQTLEVTDDQYTYIQTLREHLSEEVVGRYGYVRDCDAVQFLIDNLDGDAEGVPELDGMPAVESMNGAGAADADATESADADDSADPSSTDEAPPDGVDPAEVDEGETAADGEDQKEETDAGDGSEEAEESATAMASTRGGASDDDMLDRMMNLLETHEDKWDESQKGDVRYEVELPDGTVADAQTKDDVRALLFRHY